MLSISILEFRELCMLVFSSWVMWQDNLLPAV